MGADPFTIALAVASAAAAGGGALANNSAVKRSERAAVKSAQVERNQLASQAVLERTKRALDLDRARGRLRVLAADAGQSLDGSFGLLMDQAVLDYQLNQRIADANYASQGARLQSGLEAQFAALSGQKQSPLFAALQGGVQGAMAGHAIDGFFGSGGGGDGGGGGTDTGMGTGVGGVDSSLNALGSQSYWSGGSFVPLTIGNIRGLATQ